MSFVVSARKYRPQNFDELVGQDHIAKTLKSALKNDQLAHAFLFSGPRGVGKTTSARILARVLNCQDLKDDYIACNACSSCLSFQENASFNIFELDAASNNSVEHIRALNEQVRFQPQQGSYKIYIIDEVHMLSQAAFNAFLKTLEEPPPYAKFILATTEKHKIIPTILSRCQIFDFKRLRIKDIVEQLTEIAKKENRNIEDNALHLIAQKADGAMRDGLSIFDKVVSSVEGDITYKEVATSLNVLDYEYYFQIVDAAIKENLPEIMLTYHDICQKGFESEQFVLGLMAHIRDLMMIRDVKTASILDVAESLTARYESQAALTTTSFLLSSLSVLNDCDINLPRSQNKRLSVEIALSKICYLNRVIDKKKSEDRIEPKIKIENTTTPSDKDTSDEEPKEPKTTPAPESKPKSIKAQPPPTNPTAPKPTINKTAIPTISTDLDNLINGGETKKNKVRDDLTFSEEGVQQLLDEYKKETDSKSVSSALRYIKPQISPETITFLSPNQVFLDFVKQESRLLEIIHEQFANKYTKIDYEVSPETFPNYSPPKKPRHLTTKEKFDLLLEKNPEFQLLVDEFKLKIKNN